MAYLLEKMAAGAEGPGTVTFLSPDGADVCVGWGELYADAVRAAGILQSVGVGPGRSVAVLALTSRASVTAAMATWLAGGVLTMTPTPARTMDEATYVAETGVRIDHLEADPLVLVGSPFQQVIPALMAGGRRRVRSLDDVLGPVLSGSLAAPAWRPPELTVDDPAILQLTSGTTASAKIVRISHGNLAANVEAFKAAARHDENHGRALTWLPLSHDMGLIGTLVTPMTCGACDALLSNPLDYLAQPANWMRLIATHRATATGGPTSAYALAAKLLATGPPLDLSSLRRAMIGGETVDPEVMETFATAAARHGAHPKMITPAYGLAESVVIVTLSPLDRGLAVDEVDADSLDIDGQAIPATPASLATGPGPARRARRLVRLGPPVQGTRIRIADPTTGDVLPERTVGEIQVDGPSVTSGYHGDLDASARIRTGDGWLRTGDLGYLVDEELVVTGRIKDVIILAGRNIYPADVEAAASRAEDVRPGNAAAFAYQRPGHLSAEGLAVAVETRADNHDVIRAAVAEQVRSALGIAPHRVIVLPPGSLPKTPSGKLQRAEARRLFVPQ
jgi:fatty-acyl-CoA synthase